MRASIDRNCQRFGVLRGYCQALGYHRQRHDSFRKRIESVLGVNSKLD